MEHIPKRMQLGKSQFKEYIDKQKSELLNLGLLADKIMWSFPIYSLIYNTVACVDNVDDESTYSKYICKEEKFMYLFKKVLMYRYGFRNISDLLDRNDGFYKVTMGNKEFEIIIVFRGFIIEVFIYRTPYSNWNNILDLKFK